VKSLLAGGTGSLASSFSGSSGGTPDVPDAPSNPFTFIGGAILNTFRNGIPNIVKGLQSLIGVGVHDIGGAVLQAIPGEQGGWERQIEQEGYQAPVVAQSLLPAIAEDYKSRYGFGEEGAGEAVDRFYDDPLAYILDALLVGQVVSKGAKIGNLAGVVSDDLATKIRGISPATEAAGKALGFKAKPTTPYGSLVGTGKELGGTEAAFLTDATAPITGMRTSFNPLVRWMQNSVVNKWASRAADEVDLMDARHLGMGSSPSPELRMLASKKLANYVKNDIRVLKPLTEQFLQSSAAKVLFGTSQDKFYGIRNEALNHMTSTMGDIRGRHWGDAARAAVQESKERYAEFLTEMDTKTIGVIQNTHFPVKAAVQTFDSLDIDVGPVQRIDGLNPQAPQATVMQVGEGTGSAALGDFAVWQVIDEIAMGNAKGIALGVSPTRIGKQNPDGTYRAPNGAQLAYDVPVVSMQGAWQTVVRIAEKLGVGQSEIRLIDNLSDGSPLKGHRYVFTTADELTPDGQTIPGKTIELNVGTPELLRAQRNVWHILETEPDLQKLLTTQEAMLLTLGGPDALPDLAKRSEAIAVATANVAEEIEAAHLMAKHLMQYPLRKMADAYKDGHLEAADFLRNWEYEHVMKTWLTEFRGGKKLWTTPDGWVAKGQQGPYTTAMIRAYAPLRYQVFNDLQTAVIEPSIRKIVETAKTSQGVKMRAVSKMVKEDLMEVMAKNDLQYHGGAIGRFWNSIRYNPTKSVDENVANILEQWRLAYREPFVENATIPLVEWQSMYKSLNPVPGREILPTYFPHIRASNFRLSEMLYSRRSLDDVNTVEPNFSKGWRGYLLEKDQVLMDVEQAYSRVAAAYLRHQEMMDLIDQMVLKQFTRLITNPDELAEISRTGKMTTGERLWVPDAIKRKFGMHSEILDEVYNQMRTGKGSKEAVDAAVDIFADHIAEYQAQNLKYAQIYAVPKKVAEQFEKQVKSTFGAGTLQLFWDGPINLWRSAVLGMNPRWLLYNEMGNVVFTGIKNPAALPRIFSQWRSNEGRAAKLLLGESSPDVDLGSGGFVTKERQLMGAKHRIPDDSPFINLADTTYAIRDSKVFNPLRWWTGKIFNANTMVENAARRGVIIDSALKNYVKANGQALNVFQRMFMSDTKAMKLISEKGITESLAKQLLDDVNGTLGNYTALSSWERSVLRRFFIPFYPFYRHITKFVLKLPYENPIKSEIFRLLGEVDKDLAEEMPEFLGGGVYLGQLSGMDTWLRVQNFNPLDAFTNPRGQGVQLFNPVIGTAAAWQFGSDPLGRPYKDEGIYESPSGFRIKNGEVFEGVTHPSLFDSIMLQFPQSQVIPGLRYEPFSKNSTAATRLLGLAGVPVTRYDVGDFQMRALLAKMQALSSPEYLQANS
jgi:uncharacterized protein YggL (DUF469 family)